VSDKRSSLLQKVVTYVSKEFNNIDSCGLYYKCVMIVIDAPSVVKVTLQIVASLIIVIDDAS
jgi:hypothetical protein